MRYSIIVPVFNRPDEVDELLESLTRQTEKDFEVIIVEDGSTKDCKSVCEGYANTLDLHYFYKDNSGPGQSRNYGAERAHGEYLIVLDSDVVLPEGYLSEVEKELHSLTVSFKISLFIISNPRSYEHRKLHKKRRRTGDSRFFLSKCTLSDYLKQ